MDLGKQALRKTQERRPGKTPPTLWKTRILTEKTGACHWIEYGV
jgi:hypothetical protein